MKNKPSFEKLMAFVHEELPTTEAARLQAYLSDPACDAKTRADYEFLRGIDSGLRRYDWVAEITPDSQTAPAYLLARAREAYKELLPREVLLGIEKPAPSESPGLIQKLIAQLGPGVRFAFRGADETGDTYLVDDVRLFFSRQEETPSGLKVRAQFTVPPEQKQHFAGIGIILTGADEQTREYKLDAHLRFKTERIAYGAYTLIVRTDPPYVFPDIIFQPKQDLEG